jgi:hypothetical protein
MPARHAGLRPARRRQCALTYYYSPHAERVFASQAGRVTGHLGHARARPHRRRCDAQAPLPQDRDVRRLLVARQAHAHHLTGPSAASTARRQHPAGKIETVNPVYNANFPAVVAEEYKGVGLSRTPIPTPPRPPRNAPSGSKSRRRRPAPRLQRRGPHLRRISRRLKAGASTVHEFLGADIVDVVRVAPPSRRSSASATKSRRATRDGRSSRSTAAPNGAPPRPQPNLTASPSTAPTPAPTACTILRRARKRQPRPRLVLLARENRCRDSLPEYALRPNLGIYWPKAKTLPPRSGRATSRLPPLHRRDHRQHRRHRPAVPPASCRRSSSGRSRADRGRDRQRHPAPRHVNFTGSDGLNRTLLKFTAANEVWYVRLFTQAETAAHHRHQRRLRLHLRAHRLLHRRRHGATPATHGRRCHRHHDHPTPANFTAATHRSPAAAAAAPPPYRPRSRLPRGDGSALAPPPAVGDRIAPRRLREGRLHRQRRPLPSGRLPHPLRRRRRDRPRRRDHPRQRRARPKTCSKSGGSKKSTPPSAAFQSFYVAGQDRHLHRILPGLTRHRRPRVQRRQRRPQRRGRSRAASTSRTTARRSASIPTRNTRSLIAGRVYALRDDLNNTTANAAVYTSSRSCSSLHLAHRRPPRDARLQGRARARSRRHRQRHPLQLRRHRRHHLQPPMPLPILPLPLDAAGNVPTPRSRRRRLRPARLTGANNTADTEFHLRGPQRLQLGLPRPPRRLARQFASPLRAAPATRPPSSRSRRRRQRRDRHGHRVRGAIVALTAITVTPGSGYTGTPHGHHQRAAAAPARRPSPTSGPRSACSSTTRCARASSSPASPPSPPSAPFLPYLRPLIERRPDRRPRHRHAAHHHLSPRLAEQRPRAPRRRDAHAAQVRPARRLQPDQRPGPLPAVRRHRRHAQAQRRPPRSHPRKDLRPRPGGLSPADVPPHDRLSGKNLLPGPPAAPPDPLLLRSARGTKGALVLLGVFVDEPAGEDYLNLNVLSADDKTRPRRSRLPALDRHAALLARRHRSAHDQGRDLHRRSAQSRHLQIQRRARHRRRQALARSATPTPPSPTTRSPPPAGRGWVTMLFGNGRAFTPDRRSRRPASLQSRAALYTGELKVLLSSNPLDEKVSLRHSGDFAARPDDYEFEWRYAPPQDGVAPPSTLRHLAPRALGTWQLVQNPAGALPTAAEYAAAPTGPRCRAPS